MMNKRIDYIDVIKGVVIFCVVWVHTSYPKWLTALLVNSIFFFCLESSLNAKLVMCLFERKSGL